MPRRFIAASGRAVALACLLLAARCAGPLGGPAADRPQPRPDAPIDVSSDAPVGWAAVAGLGHGGTTGGGAAPGVRVSSDSELAAALAGDEPRNILLVRPVSGEFEAGANKTLIGGPDVYLHGHLALNGSINVIVRNLRIVGYNCRDSAECKHGKDAVTLSGGAHHVWFDHCDISDGSDGNLDVVEGSDYVTVSWTVFSYSGARPGEHQYSNLIGNSDTADDSDRGHLRVTFHHVWWRDNVVERMPRVRFGQVHVFNSLYTSAQGHYCIGLGVGASVLAENNAFIGVRTPFETKFSDAASVLVARGNLFSGAAGPAATSLGAAGFAPPYPYTLDVAAAVPVAVSRGAGVPRPGSGGAGIKGPPGEL